ncbi:hypothetical protein RHGRI_012256 [Rhododendron griersonianum]|uniref:Uncharacterized protein n=1 Tax=Rhododendron griersonianum TaxID=479676 RepID=A0AAV6KQC4_9ERIC|nr:hypothetical protein RHGRI_012256 [Rhododendron griersonianum]
MASAIIAAAIIANLLLLLLHPWTATSDIFAPVLDNVCKGVECGKGNCKPSLNTTFFFVCECEIGWKQTRSDKDDDFKFLPCVIPNCTMDFSCTEPAPSVQDKETRANTSIFDPCHWSDCGGGTCNKTSPVTYTCECKQGYYNLLKIGAFPCFQDCALGMDCAHLGISIMNNSSPTSPSSMTDSGTNQASSPPHGIINWLITVTMILAPVILKSN